MKRILLELQVWKALQELWRLSPGLPRDRPSFPVLLSQRNGIDQVFGYFKNAQPSEAVRQIKGWKMRMERMKMALAQWPRTSYRTSARVR